jgi:hypothetical protein
LPSKSKMYTHDTGFFVPCGLPLESLSSSRVIAPALMLSAACAGIVTPAIGSPSF